MGLRGAEQTNPYAPGGGGDGAGAGAEALPREPTSASRVRTPAVVTHALCVALGVSFLVPYASGVLPWSEFLYPRGIDALDGLIYLGALVRERVLEEPWRLLAASALHGGVLHLAFNLLALRSLGRLSEGLAGAGTVLGGYLAGVLMGGLAFLLTAENSVSVGASNGVFGVGWAFVAWLWRAQALFPPGVAMRVASQLGGSLLLGLGFLMVLTWLVPATAVIDHAGHLGGSLAGLLVGLLSRPRRASRKSWAVPLLGALVVASCAVPITRALREPPPPELRARQVAHDTLWMLLPDGWHEAGSRTDVWEPLTGAGRIRLIHRGREPRVSIASREALHLRELDGWRARGEIVHLDRVWRRDRAGEGAGGLELAHALELPDGERQLLGVRFVEVPDPAWELVIQLPESERSAALLRALLSGLDTQPP